MTDKGNAAQSLDITAPWKDKAFAAAWAEKNAINDPLDYPRSMATSLVAEYRPEASLVIDVASGPGSFLDAFLDEFPRAHGIWVDASDAMLEHAKRRLARHGARVEYLVSDMRALNAAGLPRNADVISTSRAAHHLDRQGLGEFYREAADHLLPGGWLLNLDHTWVSKEWKARYQSVRTRMRRGAKKTPDPTKSTHHHDSPLVRIEGHLEAIQEAGLVDVDMPWKGFQTCLFVGRRPAADHEVGHE